MNKILIFYYSRTGNTEKMAKAVEEGAKKVDKVEVDLMYHIVLENLVDYAAIVVGVPTYHHDMTVGIKKLFEDAALKNINLKDKVGAAFGSYGWSGEAPKLVLEIMKKRFEMNIIDPPLHIKYVPDSAGLDKCREFGKKIAKTICAKE
ncbi:FprA family A-type flavoprotein [Candidatus Bathyarchaeota archaeon]|jgi:flavorubredoxin|nr:MAG: FprA family A-type flavoprotein [Candidatus Bathyarchaeota archaeon]